MIAALAEAALRSFALGGVVWIGLILFRVRELDFLASLRTGWRLLYRRELMRLIRGDVEAGEARPEARPISWRAVSG
ncbi:hypothetical protein [Bradyrhizobium genosp. A]|uniref:hypothetical protein n=1 Tax=Bradyrhizobium genosp. A TaxID=83626 RepID=UPI003CE74CE1